MNEFEKPDGHAPQVDTRKVGDNAVIIKLSGSVNINHGAQELRQKVQEALKGGILKFGLDMSETANIDNSIIAEVASIAVLSNNKARISIFGPKEKVKAVINNTLLSIGANESTKKLISIHENQNAAMQALDIIEKPAVATAGG